MITSDDIYGEFWADLARMINGYLECALWSSNDPDTEAPLDNDYEVCDIDEDWLKEHRSNCYEFAFANENDLFATGEADFAQHGHDFWLTRNHHGTGFWDRGYDDDVATRLTENSHVYGEAGLMPIGDGRIGA